MGVQYRDHSTLKGVTKHTGLLPTAYSVILSTHCILMRYTVDYEKSALPYLPYHALLHNFLIIVV